MVIMTNSRFDFYLMVVKTVVWYRQPEVSPFN